MLSFFPIRVPGLYPDAVVRELRRCPSFLPLVGRFLLSTAPCFIFQKSRYSSTNAPPPPPTQHREIRYPLEGDDLEDDDDAAAVNAVIDGEGRPVPVRLRDTLFLLLTGVYVRHGDTSASCMQELTRLLSETPFFHGDMRVGAGAGLGGVTGTSYGRTLLDFSVEVGSGGWYLFIYFWGGEVAEGTVPTCQLWC